MNVRDIDREMEKYQGIIGLPHHVSETRAAMPAGNRAAQFAPFAALTGYIIANGRVSVYNIPV